MGSRQGRQARQGLERRSLPYPLIIHFLVQGKRNLHHDPCNLLILLAFDLSVLSVLGANLFPDP